MIRRGTIPFLVTICVCVAPGSRSFAQQPTFVTTPAGQTLCEGEEVTFNAAVNFNGGQQPFITWDFDGGSGFTTLNHGDRGGRVTITTDILADPATSVLVVGDADRAADAGIYKCTATSQGGGTFVTAVLAFEDAPSVDPIVVVPGDFNGMCLGDEVNLDAQPGGSDPPNQLVVWGFAENGGSPNTSITQFSPNPATAAPTFTPLASGTYILEATTFDCTPQAIASATLTVEVFAPLSASPTPPTATTCVTVPVQMAANPSGGNGNYEFLWTVTPGDGVFRPNAMAENPTFTPFVVLPGGPYELSVTVSAPASASVVCAASDPAIALIDAQTNPIVIATANQQQMCVGGSEGLSVDVTPPDGEYVYSWSIADGPELDPAQLSGADGASPTFTPSTASMAGTPYQLQVDVSGGNCEAGFDTIDIVVNEPANVAPTATPSVVCVGGGAQMAANPSGSDMQGFQWTMLSGPDLDIVAQFSPTFPSDENPVFTPSTLGVYQLQIQLFDAFCANPATQTVDVEAKPALSVAPTPTDATVCPNTPVPLSANPAGGSGTYTFSWSIVSAPGGGTGEFSTAENPTFIPSLLGTYELEVVIDAQGCEATDPASVTIEVISQVNMTATTGDAEVCLPNNSTAVHADTGGVNVPVTWSILAGSPDTDPGQFNDPTAASTFFTPSMSGQYTLQVEATGTGGDCGDSSDTLIIDAYDMFTAEATAGSETICMGEDTSLLVTTTGSGVSNQFITWSIIGGPDADAESQISDIHSDFPTFTPTAATSPGNEYIIEAEVFDPACGETLRDNVTVSVNGELSAAPSADLPGVAACEGVAVNLSANATGGDGTYTYLWSIAIGPSDPPSVISGPNDAQPTFTPMVGPADYTLDVRIDDEVCEPTELFYTLSLPVEAALEIAPSREFDSGVLGEPMALHANEIGGTAPTFAWTVLDRPDDCTDNPLTNANTADPTFTPGCVGVYGLRVAASDPVCDNVVLPLSIDVILFTATPTADPPGLCDQTPAQFTVLSANLTDNTFGPFTYLWTILDGSPNTSGAQFDSQTVAAPTLTPTDAGVYTIQVVASQTAGQLPDITAQLGIEVSTDAPTFGSHPADVTVCAGEPATFTAAASGTDVSLQWMLNDIAVLGETSTTLAIQTVAFNDAGTYTCVASNGCSQATSQPAVLTVNPPIADTLIVGVREDAILREANTIGCTITGNLVDRGALGIDNQGAPFDLVAGLAVAPLDNTLYGAVRVFAGSPETFLVTIDPLTGAAELIASMGQPIADLTFHPDGTLYAIRGNHDCLLCPGQQGQPGEIFTVNLADATLTALDPPLDFGNAAGHAITFDDQDLLDHKLYHHGRVPNVSSRLTRTDLDARQEVILRDFAHTVSLTAMTIHDSLFIAAHRASPNELWSLDADDGYQETVIGPVVTPGLPNRSILGLVFVCLSPGDVDTDCDIDLDDFGVFQACVTAPPPMTPQCATLDNDGDGDVDLTDWGAFQVSFTGAP